MTNNEDLLFHLLEQFPIPIHLYRANGISAFLNSAFKETFNIKDTGQVIGKFNLINDPFHNDILNLRGYIEKVFSGHPILVENVKVPLEYITEIFRIDRKDVHSEIMYQSIRAFPIKNANGGVDYVVIMFELKKYYGFSKNISAAKEVIESQAAEKFNIDEAAKACNMSKVSLIRLFKKHLNQTPHDYWLDLKIARLKEELQNPNITVNEAFAACDMDYNSHYTRLFKMKTGLTPLQYKNRERERVR